MPRNVEIKARIADPESLQARVAAVSDDGPHGIDQDDTFFHCTTGRLKLRDFGDGRGELIFYRRADQSEPGESTYHITPTAQPASLRQLLSTALGVRGRVRKQRTLYRIGRTRIHFDHVARLGHFVELEVVLAEGESVEAGREEAGELMQRLSITEAELIDVAYVDLLDVVGP